MTFDEVLSQIADLLRREMRVSYRGLKRRFDIDDAYLEDIKEELIGAKRIATDEDGRFLVLSADRSEAERRQLTVMFCDLVGSLALSEKLDPEELRDVIRAYQATCSESIRRYDGQVTQHLGDGLLAYFGYPHAHEDDARRAVKAALEIVSAVGSCCFATLPSGPQALQVRVGIHTGLVVIGEVGSGDRREKLALGETPNIAARLQALAEPDTVAISAATRSLVDDLFDFGDLGLQSLKGLSNPTAAFRVLRERGISDKIDSVLGRGLIPLAGRESELEALRRRWAVAKSGEGQVVLLSGEAGIGKSRLIQEMRAQLDAEGARRIEFSCSPYHMNSTFFPIIDYLQRSAGFDRAEPLEAKLLKLGALLDRYQSTDPERLALIAALLSLPHPLGAPALTLRPQQQKQRTMAAVAALLLDSAEQRTICIVFEDLHWMDSSTLELLQLMIDRGSSSRVMLLFSCRPEFRAPWTFRRPPTQIDLARLEPRAINEMIERLTLGKYLPDEIVSEIVSRTDGVPLFVEELTKMLVESELCKEVDGRYELIRPMPSFAIPSTIQDSLTARLDQLAPVREIAQWGAVLGREFTYELVRAVAPFTEEKLVAGLRQLVTAGLMFQRGIPPRAEYIFKHALVRDTAYQSVLKSKRQHMHKRTANILDAQFPEIAETEPGLLAHHYSEARAIGPAVEYWQKAGMRAAQRSAYVEARTQLKQGLALLNESADAPERWAQELALQSVLGPVLIATKGWGSSETHATYFRTRELSVQLGRTGELFRALRGIVSAQILEGKLSQAQELGEQLLSLAGEDPQLLLEAHNTLGFATTYFGNLSKARKHLEQTVTLHRALKPRRDKTLPALTAQNPSVAGMAHLAFPRWALGYPDQALQTSEDAMQLSRELAHPFSIVYATCLKSMLHSFRGEGSLAFELAEEVLKLSREQGFSSWWSGNGLCVSGWAMVNLGNARGTDRLVQGIAAIRSAGTELVLPYYLCLLAAAYGKSGETSLGLRAIDEALALATEHSERLWEPELHRQKGELELQTSHPGRELEAEACFMKALELSRVSHAKSWELRAATSLARLWQGEDRALEALSMLGDTYLWFTEGEGTRDLNAAKALLAELT